MRLIFLYHRVGAGKYSNSLELFDQHFSYIHAHTEVLLPGEEEASFSITLSFDDASYDFYHYIFPLLQKYKMRALLGVAPRYIMESASTTAEERLSIPYTLAMQDGIFETKAPFCTWRELEEMVESGLVEVASHSFSHPNLLMPTVHLPKEVVHSKEVIEKRLGQKVTSFIYPFGKCSKEIDRYVKEHYTYSYRIGSALNWKWHKEGPLFRIPMDQLPSATAPFRLYNYARWALNAL